MENNDAVSVKIDKWKKALLDLTMRNRLINFRTSKTSNLMLINPSSSEIFNKIVLQEKQMSFIPIPPEDDEEQENKITISLKANQIQADREEKEMNLVLNRLKLKSRTSYEEMGINTLFMAFGFLKWKEVDYNKSFVISPLLLVPVSISRETIASPYSVRIIDDDIVLNPTLSEKLQEFGLDLESTYDQEMSLEESTLRNLFVKVRKLIEPIEGWSVIEDVALGVFSFAKLAMYKDLENYEDMIFENSVLRTIAEGKPLIAPDNEHDELPDLDVENDPLNCYQILDADSSQQEAILAVKSGQDLVIQGPPGTGKSQTIANIIAESLSQGKRVLFVSEKMAALEVVKRRLDDCELGDFCLELHSKKTGKRVVLDELERVLNEANNHAVDTKSLERELSRLKEIRERLNSYVRRLHEKRTSLEISAFELHGNLAALHDVDLVSFDVAQLQDLTHDQLDKIINNLDNLKRHAEIYRNHKKDVLNKVKAVAPDAVFVMRIRQSLTKIRDTIGKLRKIGEETSLEWRSSISKELEYANSRISTILDLFESGSSAEEKALKLAEEVLSHVSTIKRELPSSYGDSFINLKSAIDEVKVSHSEVTRQFDALRSLLGISNALKSVKLFEETVSLLTRYRPAILQLNHNELQRKFSSSYNSFFGRLFGGYKKNVRILSSLKYDGVLNYERIVEDLEKSERVLSQCGLMTKACNEKELISLLESSKGIIESFNESYDNLEKALRSSESDLIELIEYFSFFSILPKGNQNQQAISGRSDWVKRAITATNSFFKDLEEVSDMVITEPFSDGKSLSDFEGFEDFVQRLQESLPKLDDWLSMKKSIIFLEKAGLEDFLERARESEVESDVLDKVFLKGFYSNLLSELYAKDEVLNSFSTSDHNLLVKEFRLLDSKQQLYARKRLASFLAQRIPVSNLVNSGSAETSILRREIAKKRRNKSIRRLFSETPNLLQVLKPCMMMSPLSVSVFTDPEKFKFDVAIFDEASQVFPEDSVGAIMRAKQVVVVGDNKQLPPTSFFRISEPDEAEMTDEENDLESLESILDECSAAGLPEKKLLWHYRSRHESLIAFSNYHFYMNRLSTFPSSSFNGLDSGICFEYVSNGVYDRAKSRKNIEEARRVAEMVMSHARTKAGVSLGVVAFSEAQQTAILDRIEELRSQDQSVEDFFGEDKVEPFFVKNLENVQGDERDEMIFSIGYGRDASGKLTMNFGPLNKNGGERRLNVAITRAKRKVTVVSSIRGADISAEIQTPGVRALREYLNYAEEGGSREFLLRETENTGGEFESPFEEEVYEELTARGFNVHKQVGCSGYRIDLAIVDNEHPGRYVAGIECDGAMYHSARTARDRDRLRQQVLENLGWKIIRIWSRDWIFDRSSEIKRVIAEIGAAGSVSENTEALNINDELIVENPLPSIKREETTLPLYERFSPHDLTKLVSLQKVIQLYSLIGAIIEKEAPVHLDEVVSRIIMLFDTRPDLLQVNWDMYTKSGNVSRKSLREYVMAQFPRDSYVLQGDFLLKRNERILPRRSASRDDMRKPEHIPPVEIQEAIKLCLKNAFTMDREDLKTDVARLFGYKRTGTNISNVIDNEVSLLIRNHEIQIQDGKVSIRKQ
ncbi:hypothetical protein V512_014465 [Mesotoga sp. Brook.08.105.5.1]|uniref:DUF4011 domain-containing protein n=3 Tax=unclassified Mesotoga TaxID=1184398 RepID=UPI000C175151|nr:DUF4011 domain-containing protein [Mesotoga sp. Brook.08.105.5.1]PVD18073.1 hypothetical protein V512_014465 [Mesotoga sp. Brook.08.105.5.1]